MDINKMKLATTVDFELADGTTVQCTLAMYRLKMMASKKKTLYKDVMSFLSKGSDDIFDQLHIAYAAYVCANIDAEEEDLLTEDEFIIGCGSDYTGVGELIQSLIDPKKRTASANRSN